MGKKSIFIGPGGVLVFFSCGNILLWKNKVKGYCFIQPPSPPPPKKTPPLYLGESSKCSLFIEFTLYLKQVGYEGGMLERKQDQNRSVLWLLRKEY